MLEELQLNFQKFSTGKLLEIAEFHILNAIPEVGRTVTRQQSGKTAMQQS